LPLIEPEYFFSQNWVTVNITYIYFLRICFVNFSGSKTFAVVTDRKDSVRVQNLLRASEDGFPAWDVLHSSWLLGAAKGELPLVPGPSDFVLLSIKSHLRLKSSYDAFGDSFTCPATLDSLKTALARVPEDAAFDRHQLDELEDQLLLDSSLRSVFRPCAAFFDQFLQVIFGANF